MYEKKAGAYLNAHARAAEEAAKDNNGNQSDPATLPIGDPRDFWIKQVLYKFIVYKIISHWYFKDFGKEFKTKLPEIAIDLLCVPPTSTSSERMFSCAGYLSQNRSARINSRNLERRVIVKSNKIL